MVASCRCAPVDGRNIYKTCRNDTIAFSASRSSAGSVSVGSNMRGEFQKAGTPVRPSLACLHGPGLECGASRCSIRRFVALCPWGICKLPPTNLLFSVFSPCTFPPDIPDYRLTACQVWQSHEVCLEKPPLSPDTYSLITIKPAWSTVRWCYSWFHNPAAILTRNPVLQLSTRRTPTRLSLSTFLADCYWGRPS